MSLVVDKWSVDDKTVANIANAVARDIIISSGDAR